jgi:cytochrome P450
MHAISSFHTNSRYDVILAHWPKLLWLTKRLTRWHPGNKGGADTALTIRKVRERKENGKPTEYTDFFHHLLEDRHGQDVGLSMSELEKEAGVMINAGSDTTATAMTHCLYFLIRNPLVLARLRAELEAVLGRQYTAARYEQSKGYPISSCMHRRGHALAATNIPGAATDNTSRGRYHYRLSYCW